MSQNPTQVPGFFAAVDGGGRLAEVGWQKFPRLMHLAWGAQWLDYTARLAANLSRPALTLPVFQHQVPRPPPKISLGEMEGLQVKL